MMAKDERPKVSHEPNRFKHITAVLKIHAHSPGKVGSELKILLLTLWMF